MFEMAPFFSRWRNHLIALFAGVLGSTVAQAPKEPPKSAGNGPASEKGPLLAFVCLNKDSDPAPDLLKQKVAAWLQLKGPEEVKLTDLSEKDDMEGVSFEVNGKNVIIVRAGFPIPKDDIDYACQNAVLWPEAAKVLAKHKSHLVVTVFGNFPSPVEQGLFLSRVLAACTELYDANSIYWGHATVVHKPDFFREQIRKADARNLPILAWVGFLRARGKEEGTFDLYTRGLNVFGVMEIEVVGTRRMPSEVFGRVTDLGLYLLTRGNVVQDGHTIGSEEKEKIRTRHAESVIGRKGKVLRVEL